MKAYDYSHIGKKDRNEDYTGFHNGCYLVCDGVGGSTKGELASREVVTTVLKAYPELQLGKTSIPEIVERANNRLNELVQQDPSLDGMATTLAAVFFYQQKVQVAHIGDSRVYLVRPSEKQLWHTWDHSLVGNLVRKKEISREAGRTHPLNNQIFKALKGNMEGSTTAAEINTLTDLREEDLILICSDGVMESFSEQELLDFLMKKDLAPDVKLGQIREKCSASSNDNHSAILILLEREDLLVRNATPFDWIHVDELKEESDIEEVEITELKQSLRERVFSLFKRG